MLRGADNLLWQDDATVAQRHILSVLKLAIKRTRRDAQRLRLLNVETTEDWRRSADVTCTIPFRRLHIVRYPYSLGGGRLYFVDVFTIDFISAHDNGMHIQGVSLRCSSRKALLSQLV